MVAACQRHRKPDSTPSQPRLRRHRERILQGLQRLGFVDPAGQMLLLRLLHGLFSLLIVALGFRIAEKLGGERPARWTGWALAAFGLFPLLGVRQLVEMVCIPPLMWSAWVVCVPNGGHGRPGHWPELASALPPPCVTNAVCSDWAGSSLCWCMNANGNRPFSTAPSWAVQAC